MSRWEWNYEQFGDLLQGPEMQALMADRIDKARAAAEGMAQDFRVTGDYAGSFQTEVKVEDTNSGRRAVGHLRNTSDHALAVEYGNGRSHKPHHVLGKSIDYMR